MPDTIATTAAATTDPAAILAATLTRLRTDAGLSLNELDRRAGLAKSTARSIETGKAKNPAWDTVRKLADVLGVTADVLAGVAPAAASASPGEPDPANGVRRLVAMLHGQITPSLWNPRTTFQDKAYKAEEDEELLGLAQSIVKYGLIQPLIVDPSESAATGTRACLKAGERRWRAIGLAIARGDLPADWPIPCLLAPEPDTREGIILAGLIENLRRQDLAPMDEAEAYARLCEGDWTPVALAEEVGTSRRHIELRLRLVRDLAPPAQEALRNGEIALAAARALCTAPQEDQAAHLKSVLRGAWGYTTAEAIRGNIVSGKPVLQRAAFKVEEYEARGGSYLFDEDGAATHFASIELFREMQLEAATARAEKLRAGGKYAFVELRNDHTDHGYGPAGYEPVFSGEKIDKAKVGVFVTIRRDWSLETVRYVKAVPQRGAVAGSDGKPARPEFTKAHAAKANRIKSEFVRAHLAVDRVAALTLAILGLLGVHEVRIRAATLSADDRPETRMRDVEYLAGMFMPEEMDKRFRNKHSLAEADALALWSWLSGLDEPRLTGILAALVARQYGSWNSAENYGGNPTIGDTALFVAVAGRVLADAEPGWFAFTEEYVATLGKPSLLEIVRASGNAMRAFERSRPKGIDSLTGKKLREIVMALAGEGALTGFVPRELRVGSAKALAKPLPAADAPPDPLTAATVFAEPADEDAGEDEDEEAAPDDEAPDDEAEDGA